MNSNIRIAYYNHVCLVGFPIVIGILYELSPGNHIAEVFIIQANYNRDSKIEVKKYVDVNSLLKRFNDPELTLDFVLNIVVNEYQENLLDKNEDLINRSLPLQKSTYEYNSSTLELLLNANAIIEELKEVTNSTQLTELLESLSPYKLNFKSM